MEPVLKCNDLSKKFGRKPVLQGITFELPPGQSLGIFGTRGTGKTTLLHILAGIESFNSGQVEVFGTDINKSDKFKTRIGLVTQQNSLFQDMTVAENLDFIAALKKAPKTNIEEAIEQLELGDFMKERVAALPSVGLLQRLSLACALLNNPELLISDEILKDIDLESLSIILRKLKAFQSEGKTLICSFSHISDIASYPPFNEVGWLEGGKINFYHPSKIRSEWARQMEQYQERNQEQSVRDYA